MADVSTYRRCTETYATNTMVFHEGDLRAASDPAVVATPSLWAAMTDALMSDASLEPDV
jgi:hypothetical protein